MQIDEFLELVRKRRSIRKFKPDPIPDECVEKIIEAARWAMSGANAQPWEFIVVKDQETKDKLAEAIHVQRQMEYVMEMTRIENQRHNGAISPQGLNPEFNEAPVLIVVCGDRRTLAASVNCQNFDPGEGGLGGAYIKGMANATQNMQLAATAMGLGSCWTSVAHSAERTIKAILGVPDLLEVHTIVPVGYAAYEAAPSYRRELKEITHLEKYDLSRYRSIEDIVEFIADLREKTVMSYDIAD